MTKVCTEEPSRLKEKEDARLHGLEILMWREKSSEVLCRRANGRVLTTFQTRQFQAYCRRKTCIRVPAPIGTSKL